MSPTPESQYLEQLLIVVCKQDTDGMMDGWMRNKEETVEDE